MDVEELMRQHLEGKFFRYIGKPHESALEDEERELRAHQKEMQRRERELLRDANAQREREYKELQERLERDYERIKTKVKTQPTFEAVIDAVAWAHNIDPAEITGTNRKAKIVAARHHTVWELKQRKPQLSANRIALYFGRDHTTIINSLAWFPKNRHLHEGKVEAVARILNNKG